MTINYLTELAKYNQWVYWKSHPERGKVPVNPWSSNAEWASVKSRTTWSDLSQAKAACNWHDGAGLGFVFTGDDPFVGIDLDYVISPVDGKMSGWAKDIIKRVGSYAEVSPSGRGVKIICKGDLPRAYKDNSRGLEIYSTRRFFTITGEQLGWVEDIIVEAQDALDWMVEEYFPRGERKDNRQRTIDAPLSGTSPLTNGSIDPEDWIDGALDAISPDCGYDEWIKVGMALHDGLGEDGFYLWNQWSQGGTKYPDSGESYLRKKWNSFGGGRGDSVTLKTVWHLAEQNGWIWTPTYDDGWEIEVPQEGLGAEHAEGVDDGGEAEEETPEREPETPEDTHKPETSEPPRTNGPELTLNLTESQQEIAEKIEWIEMVDAYQDDSPFEPDLISPGILGKGDLMLLFGPPKSMKSFGVIDMFREFALGNDWLGVIEPARKLRVAYTQFELKADKMRQRIQLRELTPDEQDIARGQFFYTNRFTPNLNDKDQVAVIIGKLLVTAPPGIDVIVFDPLVNIFTGDNENDNTQMNEFLRRIKHIRNTISPDTAIVLVHHASKMGRQERQEEPFNSFRGAGALRGAYDTGICIEPVSETSDVRKVWFEVRNGPGVDPLAVKFEDGRFVRATGEEFGERVAGSTQGQKWDREHGRKARAIVDILRMEALRGNFFTTTSFAQKFAGVKGLGSQGSIEKRVKELQTKRILMLFDAGLYGFGRAPSSSNGHLLCDEMPIPDQDYGLTVEDAEGNVVKPEPMLYRNAATGECEKLTEEVEFVPVDRYWSE